MRTNGYQRPPRPQSSPMKRAYTAYVEEYHSNEVEQRDNPLQSYEDYVCENAAALSTQSVEETVDVENSMVTKYWDDNPQDADEGAVAFFASLSAK